MGTRNLTMVIKDKQTKIAQYGQWDGYPDSSGVEILNFLKTSDLNKFKDKLNCVRFFNDEDKKEEKEFCDSIGVTYYLNRQQAEDYKIKYPYLHRDFGSSILGIILDSEDSNILLQDRTKFATDGLFCEWVYVIDFDNNTFEVYEGGGLDEKEISETDRFFHLKKDEEEYQPVMLVKKFDLDKLPSEKEFLKYFEVCDEDENEGEIDSEEEIGTTGEIVDLFNENLTQEEWDALCVIHRLSLRLDVGIRFDWSKSIDVRSKTTSQIIDESVFLNKEKK